MQQLVIANFLKEHIAQSVKTKMHPQWTLYATTEDHREFFPIHLGEKWLISSF